VNGVLIDGRGSIRVVDPVFAAVDGRAFGTSTRWGVAEHRCRMAPRLQRWP